MAWLQTKPEFVPCVHSLDEFIRAGQGQRLIFGLGGHWQRYADFATPAEYVTTLDRLVAGALVALELDGSAECLDVINDPLGAPWLEWLLPLWGWSPDEGIQASWDPAVRGYARLFTNGVIPADYAAGCVTHDPAAALRSCVDVVMRNLAPYSWLFGTEQGRVSVYYHNTASIGVCVPSGSAYDTGRLVSALAGIDLLPMPLRSRCA